MMLLGSLAMLVLLAAAQAHAEPMPIPSLNIGVGTASKPGDVAVTIQIFLMLTILSLAPGLLIMTTSFTRIVVVLSFLRTAMGTQQAPSNQIILALSMFLTFFIMNPVWQQINKEAYQPWKAQQISQELAMERAVKPVRKFMLSQTREKDLALFVSLSKLPRPKNADDIPTLTIIPAFYDLGTAYRLSDRFSDLHPLYRCRYGGGISTDVHGYDDAAAGHDLAAVQDPVVCAGGWLGAGDRLTRKKFRIVEEQEILYDP